MHRFANTFMHGCDKAPKRQAQHYNRGYVPHSEQILARRGYKVCVGSCVRMRGQAWGGSDVLTVLRARAVKDMMAGHARQI